MAQEYEQLLLKNQLCFPMYAYFGLEFALLGLRHFLSFNMLFYGFSR